MSGSRSDAAHRNAPAQQALVAVTLHLPAIALEPARALCEPISPEGLVIGDDNEGNATVTVYVSRAQVDDTGIQLRDAGTAAIEAVEAIGEATVSTVDVPGDWRERWKEWHKPVVIGTLWIGPPWCLPAPAGKKSVVIEPGQGFGTGAHPTTRLVISMLADLPEGTMVDLGTGSGVLSIAAARMGHRVVWAADNDPAAIESARANIAANSVRVPLAVADLLSLRTEIPAADTAVANITLDPLREIVPRLKHRNLILSGLLKSQEATMCDVLEQCDYAPAAIAGRDGWIAIRAVRRTDAVVEAPPALW